MEVTYCADYTEMSRLGSNSVVASLREIPNGLLGVATGNSPAGLYENLIGARADYPHKFDRLRVLKLDEWGGIPPDDPNTCEAYIQSRILRPLAIPQDRYISFDSNPASPERECERMQRKLERHGPLDVCILGLGENGHIGFNEPGKVLRPHCHVARLSKKSMGHRMAREMKMAPTYGLTLGMVDILAAKKIILLLTGRNKAKVISALLSKEITTHLPASLLWLHPHVECYIDSKAL